MGRQLGEGGQTSTVGLAGDQAARESPEWRGPGSPGPTNVEVKPPLHVLRRDSIFRRALLGADLFAAGLSLVLSAVVVGGGGLTWGAAGFVAAVVIAAKLMGLYDRDELVFRKATLDEAPSLFHLATLFALLASLLPAFLVVGVFEGRETVVLWSSFLVLGLCGRTFARTVAGRLAPVERCLVIGPSAVRMTFAAKLSRTQQQTEVVGFVPLVDERNGNGRRPERERRRRKVRLSDLERLVTELDVHRVVVIPAEEGTERLHEAVTRAKSMGVKVSVLPRVLDVVGSSVEFDDLEGVTVLGLRPFGLTRSSHLIKRAMDVLVSALALLVLAPLLGVIALAIKLDSPGPILFRQLRVGRGGRPFEMIKFRSMVAGADEQRAALEHLNEASGLFKIRDDPRVTRVGGLLRAMSLDELPQLVNVFRGQMSLVGPRPLVLDEDRRVEGHHRGRLQLPPGLTGPWQLLGPTRVPLEDMVAMDYRYGANWSLWTDVKILLRTVAHVLTRRGL